MAEVYDVEIKYGVDTSEVASASAKAEQAVKDFGRAAETASKASAKAADTFTAAERALAAQILAAAKAAKDKATALGLTTAQLRTMEGAAAKAAAQEAKVAAEARAVQAALATSSLATIKFTEAEKAQIASTLAAEAALKAKAAAAGLSTAAMRRVQAATTTAAATTGALAEQTRGGTTAFQALATQMPDVVVQLQAGQNPMQILLQQGLQVVDQLGVMRQATAAAGTAVAGIAVILAAAAATYSVFANAAEDAASATKLLDARLTGLQSAASGAEARIKGAKDETKKFYDMVATAKTEAAQATGDLTKEDAAYEEGVSALKSAIMPTIQAQEQLIAARRAENEILREQQKALGTDIAARDAVGRKIQANRTLIANLTDELGKEKTALEEGTQAIGIKIAKDVEEEGALKNAKAAREASTASRDAEKRAMEEQRYAQELLNTAFDYEMERLTTRAAMMGEMRSKLALMSNAEIKYREELERIEVAERMGAISAEEASGLRIAASNAWADEIQRDVKKAQDAQAQLDKDTEAAAKKAQDLAEQQRQAWLSAASSVVGFTSDLLGALNTAADATMEQGEKAANKIADIRKELKTEHAKDLADMDAAEEAEHQANIARLQGELAMTKEKTKSDRKAASRAAKFAKAAALADIGLKTAQAVMAGIAQFGPPPSPVGIAAMASALAVGGIQAGVVAAVDLPTYHVGGVKPGETLSRHLPGEATLDASTTRALGGSDGLRQMQMGNMGGGMVLQIGRREVREMERIGLRSGGLYAGAIRAASTSSGPTRGISGRGVIA